MFVLHGPQHAGVQNKNGRIYLDLDLTRLKHLETLGYL
jgi:hypothetical protein